MNYKMLLSMELHPKISLHLHPSKILSGSVFLKPLKNPTFTIKHKAGNLRFQSLPDLKGSQTASRIKLSASPTEPIISEEGGEEAKPNGKERLGVLVKPMEKPRIVLKFIWMEKVIGIGLNQVIPGLGTIPLSPYYFWPKNDAWEQLKLLLESKPWISQNQMHILLSQATDMILLWQEKNARL